jgi:hypothetical protein
VRWGLLVHHGPVADASQELTGAAPGAGSSGKKEGLTRKLTTATNGGEATRFGWAVPSNCGGGMNSSAKRYGSEGVEPMCGMEAVGNRGALGSFI